MLLQEQNRKDGATHPQIVQSIAIHIAQLEDEIKRINQAIEAHFAEHNGLNKQRVEHCILLTQHTSQRAY